MKKLFFVLTIACTIFVGQAWTMENKEKKGDNNEETNYDSDAAEKAKLFIQKLQSYMNSEPNQKEKPSETLKKINLDEIDLEEINNILPFISNYVEEKTKEIKKIKERINWIGMFFTMLAQKCANQELKEFREKLNEDITKMESDKK